MAKGWRNESRRHSLASRGIKTAQNFKLSEYLGRWNQIKAFPQWYQEGCNNVVAEYSKGNGFVKVKNICDRDGKKTSIEGKAYQVDGSKLEVDFVGGRIFTGDYWVLWTDYKEALVGTPDKNSLWILSRDKTISQAKLKRLKNIAKQNGFDVSRLR